MVFVAWPLTLAVVNVRRMGAGSVDARFRVVVLLVRAGIPDGEGAGSVLLTFGEAKTGVVVLRGMRGDCLTVRGVTVGLRSVRLVTVADCDDLCVVAEASVSVGEGASARECRSIIGDIGASDDGGVGTTALARRSRSMAISLLASVRVSQSSSAAEPTAHVVFETLTLLVQLLLGDDLLFEQRLLLDRAVVLDLHVQE